MKRSISDNSGTSLVELIVSILIMSVISGIVIILISTSRVTYDEITTDAELQTESETARRFISEVAVEAQSWGSGTDRTNHRYIWFRSPNNENDGKAGASRTPDCYYVFMLMPKTTDKESRLVYGKYAKGTGTNQIANDDALSSAGTETVEFPSTDLYHNNIYSDDYSILAEHITRIECTDSKTAGSLITVYMELKYNDREYSRTLNFAGRNKNDEAR